MSTPTTTRASVPYFYFGEVGYDTRTLPEEGAYRVIGQRVALGFEPVRWSFQDRSHGWCSVVAFLDDRGRIWCLYDLSSM